MTRDSNPNIVEVDPPTHGSASVRERWKFHVCPRDELRRDDLFTYKHAGDSNVVPYLST